MEEEPEVITFREFIERNPDMKREELYKVVLVCKNCNHKDLLKNFIRKEKGIDWDNIMPAPKPFKPKPFKPRPYPDPWHPDLPKYPRYYRGQIDKKKLASLVLDHQDYEDMFYCPKCGSSLVVLCKEFTKNNILRGLESEKDKK